MADWKNDLANLFESKGKGDGLNDPKQLAAKIKGFFTTAIIPAFEEFKLELTKHGRSVQIQFTKPEVAGLTVMSRQGCELDCLVEVRTKPNGTTVAVYRERSLESGSRYYSEEDLSQGLTMTKDQFLQSLVNRYKQRLNSKA